MMASKPLLILFLLFFCGKNIAGEKSEILLIGGGPTPQASQVSIEANILWIQSLYKSRGFKTPLTYFASGKNGENDVKFLAKDDDKKKYWQPIARLYNQQIQNNFEFRPNKVNAEKDALTPALLEEVLKKQLHNENLKELFIIYSGHGGYTSPNTNNNYLRLWGEKHFSARQFSEILAGANENLTVRFLLPQCFSGAFGRASFSDLQPRQGRASGAKSCGFLSVSDRSIAEGCTVGIEEGDYRDYTSYFFAALHGKNRLGEKIEGIADTDNNGEISLREAHFHAISQGLSTDIPRTTSEYYLNAWEPWYLRWQTIGQLDGSNVYFSTAAKLIKAQHLDINILSLGSGRSLFKAIKKQEGKIDALSEKIKQLNEKEVHTRKNLQAKFKIKWPYSDLSHTQAYTVFIKTKADNAIEWLRTQEDYKALEKLQINLATTDLDRLKLKRQLAMYFRLQRLMRLARLESKLYNSANAKSISEYDSLKECESWAPFKKTSSLLKKDLAL